MQFEYVMEIINDIEKRFPVSEWLIDNISIWPLVRIQLSAKMLSKLDSDLKIISKSFFDKIKHFVKYILIDSIVSLIDNQNNQKIKKESVDVIFLSDANDRRVYLNKKWYDIYCSPIIDTLKKSGKRYFFLEYCVTGKYKLPRYEKTFFIEKQLKNIRFRHEIIIKLLTPLNIKKVSSEYLPKFSEFENYMSEMGFADYFISKEELMAKIALVLRYRDYYDKIIANTKPSKAIVVSYYGLQEMAFVLACKQSGIPVIDIQHGVQGELHKAYGRWMSVPDKGYELLPDVFAVWSKEEKEAIEQWSNSNNSHRVFVLGNIWNDMWKESDKLPIVSHLDQHVIKLMEKNDYKSNILYTLQPGVKTPNLLIYTIDHTPNIQWWIRLHPAMISESKTYVNIFKKSPNVNINEASLLPLPGILKHISVHITNHSSVVLDAASFSVKSIVLTELGVELYRDLVDSGMVYYCADSVSLMEKINELITSEIIDYTQIQNTHTEQRIMELLNFT